MDKRFIQISVWSKSIKQLVVQSDMPKITLKSFYMIRGFVSKILRSDYLSG